MPTPRTDFNQLPSEHSAARLPTGITQTCAFRRANHSPELGAKSTASALFINASRYQ
jgi:hypothetical protein